MNNYPIWWDTSITVYNRYEDPLTHIISWHRTPLQNCFWKYTGNKVKVNTVTLETNNIICRIPKNDNFKEGYEWVELPNDRMNDYFTLNPGDIIIKGIVDDTIDEYMSGKRSSDILSKYKSRQGCMEIQSMSINTGIGRNEEHYYVVGI